MGFRVRDICRGLRFVVLEKTWEGEGLGLRSIWGCFGERLVSSFRCVWVLLCVRVCVCINIYRYVYMEFGLKVGVCCFFEGEVVDI